MHYLSKIEIFTDEKYLNLNNIVSRSSKNSKGCLSNLDRIIIVAVT